jgi:hypothetical protein
MKTNKEIEKLHRDFLNKQPSGSVVTKTIKFDEKRLELELKRIKQFQKKSNKAVFVVK